MVYPTSSGKDVSFVSRPHAVPLPSLSPPSSSSSSSSSSSLVSSIQSQCAIEGMSERHILVTSGNRIVKLNIGGVRFETTKETLTSKGHNFFTALLDGAIPSTRDEQGAYFIDRNGRIFEPLLDFLRTGELIIPTFLKREQVIHEANFFSIVLPEENLSVPAVRNEYTILEISAHYMTHGKIFFRLYHSSVVQPTVVGEVSTSGYWEVQKKQLLAKLMTQIGAQGWRLSHVLGTENDDGSLPESYVFETERPSLESTRFPALLHWLSCSSPVSSSSSSSSSPPS